LFHRRAEHLNQTGIGFQLMPKETLAGR